MSKACEKKSAALTVDLKKVGFDFDKGGFFELCLACEQKYEMVVSGRKTGNCIFGCDD